MSGLAFVLGPLLLWFGAWLKDGRLKRPYINPAEFKQYSNGARL